MIKTQKQQTGDNSINVQADRIYVTGPTYAEVREIATDVFKANFLELAQDAAKLAQQRAEELLDDFLAKLKETNEKDIIAMKYPAMQMALYNAQLEYVKTGDKNLGELLVDVLVERAGIRDRNLRQIILDEALSIIPKLTSGQMNALTLTFLWDLPQNEEITDLDTLREYIRTYFAPFVTNELSNPRYFYDHLIHTGCAFSLKSNLGRFSILGKFHLHYPGLFLRGFEEEYFITIFGDLSHYSSLLMPCLYDSNKLQLNAINLKEFEFKCKEVGIGYGYNKEDCIYFGPGSGNEDDVVSLYRKTLNSKEEIEECWSKIDPDIVRLSNFLDDTLISYPFDLSPVGTAIALANFKRKTKLDTFNLSDWVGINT
jgi:hypothetical protein